MKKLANAQELVQQIHSHQRVFIHGAAATPLLALDALCERYQEINDVELIHLHIEGPAKHTQEPYRKSFKDSNLFVGKNMRHKLDYERIDYLPCFLSEIPQLFRSQKRPLDVALIHVSPPDRHGYCSLGTSVDVALAALQSAKVVLAQINSQMPRVHGDGIIHIDHIDYAFECNEKLPEFHLSKWGEVERKIGENVASIIEDGSCLQIGIGATPEAVLNQLKSHKNLGVHTEMWSAALLDLIKSGVITNSNKKIHPGKCVSGFIMGTQEVYDFIHDNPSIVQLDIEYVNNPAVIRRNPKAASINSAVEVDLTGQICADSVGSEIISGVGGQMDFMRGAALSESGKPIIALPSRTAKGKSRIVVQLTPGAGVVTTRCHVHYVATEYGIVDLSGKTLSERAKALIQIAHPEDREQLEFDRKRVYKI